MGNKKIKGIPDGLVDRMLKVITENTRELLDERGGVLDETEIPTRVCVAVIKRSQDQGMKLLADDIEIRLFTSELPGHPQPVEFLEFIVETIVDAREVPMAIVVSAAARAAVVDSTDMSRDEIDKQMEDARDRLMKGEEVGRLGILFTGKTIDGSQVGIVAVRMESDDSGRLHLGEGGDEGHGKVITSLEKTPVFAMIDAILSMYARSARAKGVLPSQITWSTHGYVPHSKPPVFYWNMN